MAQVNFSYQILERPGKRGVTWMCDCYLHDANIRQRLKADQGKPRVRKIFKTRDEAVHFGEEAKKLIEKRTRKVYSHRSNLTPEQLQAAENAMALAEEAGHHYSILEKAVDLYLQTNANAVDTRSLELHFEDWLAMKEQTTSYHTVRGYRPRVMKCLSDNDWLNKTAFHFRPEAIFDYIYGDNDSSSRNKINQRQALFNFWRYLKTKKLVNWDFEEHIPKPKAEHKIPEILTPKEMKYLIAEFREHEPQLLPWLVICGFAGIRPQGEFGRLVQGDIDIDEGYILVRSPKANEARYVPIEANLREWLIHFRDKGYDLTWHQKTAFHELMTTIGYKWKADVLRHSYASYMAPKVTLHKLQDLMGSTEATIKRYYRKPVKTWKTWWEIKP